MANENVIADKVINSFPTFCGFTPYNHSDFNLKTKQFCANFSVTDSQIKVSKMIILGDVGVGKTSIVNRFCHNVFNSNYKATIGVDFEVEHFRILGVPFHLQIWDTAGQERFKCIAKSYYRSANVILIVFDLSKIKTLDNCQIWLNDALCTSSKNPLIFLVGTKKDLLSSAAFTEVEIISRKTADSLKAEFWAVSSQTGQNITSLFFRIAALTFDIVAENKCTKLITPIVGQEIISLKRKKEQEANKVKCCQK